MSSEKKEKKRIDMADMKKYVVMVFVVVGVLFIGASRFFMSDSDDGGQDDVDDSGEELVIEDDRNKLIREIEDQMAEEDAAEEGPGDVNEASRETAKANLERTDQPAEESEEISEDDLAQMNADLQALFDLYAEDKEWEGNYYASREFSNTIAGKTSPSMSQQLDTAINLVGYKMDPNTAEWYASDTEDVYQFLVSVKVEGYDDLVFSGNYNKSDRVFDVFKMHGYLDLDEFAS